MGRARAPGRASGGAPPRRHRRRAARLSVKVRWRVAGGAGGAPRTLRTPCRGACRWLAWGGWTRISRRRGVAPPGSAEPRTPSRHGHPAGAGVPRREGAWRPPPWPFAPAGGSKRADLPVVGVGAAAAASVATATAAAAAAKGQRTPLPPREWPCPIPSRGIPTEPTDAGQQPRRPPLAAFPASLLSPTAQGAFFPMAAAFVGAAAVGAAAVAAPPQSAAAVSAPAARRAVAAARTRRVAGAAAGGGGRRGGVTMETLVWAPVGPASAVSVGATPFEAVGLALTLVATVRLGGG